MALTLGDPTSFRNIAILVGGLAFFVAVIFVELRQKYPTLDLKLFKIKQFATGNLASFMNNLTFGCGPFLRSLYLQLILGYSALKTGVLLIPMDILVLVLNPISGRLADRYGSRTFVTLGLASNASALLWFSTLNEKSSYLTVLISLMLFGFGLALFAPANSSRSWVQSLRRSAEYQAESLTPSARPPESLAYHFLCNTNLLLPLNISFELSDILHPNTSVVYASLDDTTVATKIVQKQMNPKRA